MRTLLLFAALAAATPAVAASPTPAAPAVAPVQGTPKAAPGPLRLRSPLMLDDRRIMAPGRYDSGTSKPNPKDGGGPEIG